MDDEGLSAVIRYESPRYNALFEDMYLVNVIVHYPNEGKTSKYDPLLHFFGRCLRPYASIFLLPSPSDLRKPSLIHIKPSLIPTKQDR